MTIDRLANLTGAFSLAITDAQAAAMKQASGFGEVACAVLITLGCYPESSIRELARVAGVDHSVMVRTVKTLEEAGLLTRRIGRDRREVNLHLTRRGSQMRSKLLRARAKALCNALVDFTGAERDMFEKMLSAALKTLTTSRDGADFLCRLCDEQVCGEGCPVECEARRLEKTQ